MKSMMRRAGFERVCRVLALAALLTALVVNWRASQANADGAAPAITVRIADSVLADSGGAALEQLRGVLITQLPQRAVSPGTADVAPHLLRPDSLLMPLGVIPSAANRAALGSLVAGGVPLVWGDSTGARGLAASVSRAASPGAPMDVRVSAYPAEALVLRDAGGVLDSMPRAGATVSWRLRSASPPLRVEQGKNSLMLSVPDSSPARRLLVVAQPGWEGKFVVAALEEAGWLVDGTMRVSPTGSVTIGAPQRLDTARYAAVVVLDSMAVDAAAVARFVTRGGGLVLGGDALRVPSLAMLRPARTIELRGAIAGGLLTEMPRRGLDAWELDLSPTAVVLEVDRGDHAHDEPALVARRVGAGRVVAMPYRESWRWRLQGGDDGLMEHRAWWQAAVTAAIGTTNGMPGESAATRESFPGQAAPYADLVARLGAADARVWQAVPSTTVGDERVRRDDIPVLLRPWVLLLFTAAALLAEWTSRRLRGTR